MSFDHLKRRVERGEALVEGRIRQSNECQARLKREWRAAWTPLRIVGAGLGAGLLTGRLQPEKAMSRIGKIAGPGSIQFLTSAIGLVGSLQAAFVAMTTSGAVEKAAETADEAAGEAARTSTRARDQASASAAGAGAAAGGVERSRRPDQAWESQPSPAEAATEVSER